MKGLTNYLFLFLIAGVSSLGAASGSITFLDGDVTIQRNGKTIPSSQIDIGTEVENFDLISTGRSSSVEIELNARTGINGSINLAANSAFHLELSDMKANQTAGVELMAGNVSLKVSKMLGGSGLEVRTGSAVMGVRGTAFRVIISAGGDLLVTTSEGKVQCSSDGGPVVFSQPGTVVENLGEEKMQSKTMSVASLAGFERDWQSGRMEALRSNAPRAIKNFATRYEQLYAQFNRAYDRMTTEALPTITKWTRESTNNTMASRVDVLKEKKLVITHLMAMKRASYILERVYYRLAELNEYVENGSVTGELRRGYTYKDFYKQFNVDRLNLQNKLGFTRFIMKLYALRNEGSVPTDTGGDSALDNVEDFFN
ncbi:MAG: hypothetical protein A2Z96_06025 [Spirochaetes bacterium GWB1_48_6]|nr:MAG: hypothetical protein A2Z96_06025 [Spirochaetes bacterium GWB1_48_6]